MTGVSLTTRVTRMPEVAWYGVAAVSAILMYAASVTAPLLVALVVVGCAASLFAWLSYQRPELGLVALVGGAALDVTGRLAQVGGATLTVYQGAVAVFGLVTIARLAKRRASWRPTKADVPLLLLVAFAAAAIPAAVDPRESIVQFISLISSATLVYFVVLSVDTPEQLRTVVWGTLAIAGTLGFFAVLERLEIFSIGPVLKLYGTGVRAKATFKDPNVFGSFLACALGLAMPLMLELKSWAGRIFAFSAAGLALMGLLVSFSRGALVAFLLAMLVTLLFSKASPVLRLVVLGAGAGALALFLLVYVDPVFLQERILGIANNRSALFRVYMAGAALQMWADHPMGIGLGNYPLVFPYYRPAFVLPNLVESHTAYLTVLVETGIVGFIGFMWLIVRTATGAIRVAVVRPRGTLQALAVGSVAAGAALLFQALTYSLETSKFLWLTFGVALAVAVLDRINKEDME